MPIKTDVNTIDTILNKTFCVLNLTNNMPNKGFSKAIIIVSKVNNLYL